MHITVTETLLNINRNFYNEFGESFSATRQRIQPGVRKVIATTIKPDEHILDIGCGNGEFARCLAETGFSGTYTGLDFSIPLLRNAAGQPEGFHITFQKADLASEDWDAGLQPGKYTTISAFAVLHHIPSTALRAQILSKVRRLLAPQGNFILSNWQFLNSPRLAARIQPWEKASLSSAEVEDGDYLLDWRSGGQGLRYVHYFTEPELAELAQKTGFNVVESFFSDGESGNLGLYQRWRINEN